MKRYLKVYKKLLAINFSNLIVYRTNFVNNILASLSWGGLILIQMLLLTSRSNNSFGWSRDEILLFTGIFSTIISIFHMFITPNFEMLSRNINLGKLDHMLLKPLDSQFLSSVWLVNYATFIRLILSIVFTGYFLNRLSFSLTILNVGFYLILLLLGFVVLYSLWLLVISLLFWFTRLTNIVELMFSITGMSRFPGEMFSQFSRLLFFLIFPILFIVFVPTKIFLGRYQFNDLPFLIFIAIVMSYGSRKFWLFALKHYTSAGG